MVRFEDRVDAGRRLSDALTGVRLSHPIVLALPRGGVPVAFEVATALDAVLDVLVARKVGAPGRSEYGIGAIAEGGIRVADAAALRLLHITDAQFAGLADAEELELRRRVFAYRGDRALTAARGHDVLVVDDGLATGGTAEAAVLAARLLGAARVVLAVPVCPPDTARRLEVVADAVVCVSQPADFLAVGRWYRRFAQTTDAEVVELLTRARARRSIAQHSEA
jgi:putative phosphoribosyl transferase